jgi:nitroreductase
MDVFEAIKGRCSVRAYKPDKIPDEAVTRIIEAGVQAPSAGNMQPTIYIVTKNAEVKSRLAEAALNQSFIEEAPVVIAVCTDTVRSASRYGDRGARFYSLLDAAASVENMLLAAHAMGLASCWVGAFQDEQVSRVLKLPPHVRPVAILPIGYPAEKPAKPRRRRIEDVAFSDAYGSPLKLGG